MLSVELFKLNNGERKNCAAEMRSPHASGDQCKLRASAPAVSAAGGSGMHYHNFGVCCSPVKARTQLLPDHLPAGSSGHPARLPPAAGARRAPLP